MNSKKLSALVGTIALTIGLVGCGQKTAVKVTSKPKAVVQKAKPVPQKTVIVEKTINNSAVIVNKTVANTTVNKLQVNTTINKTNNTIVNKQKINVAPTTIFTASQALTIAIKTDPSETVTSCATYSTTVAKTYYSFTMVKNNLTDNGNLLINKFTGKAYVMDNLGTISPISAYDASYDFKVATLTSPSTPTHVKNHVTSHTSAYIDSTGSLIQVTCKNYTGSMTPSQALRLAHKANAYVTLVDNNVYMINGATFYEFNVCDQSGNDVGADFRMIVSTTSGKAFNFSVDNSVKDWSNK